MPKICSGICLMILAQYTQCGIWKNFLTFCILREIILIRKSLKNFHYFGRRKLGLISSKIWMMTEKSSNIHSVQFQVVFIFHEVLKFDTKFSTYSTYLNWAHCVKYLICKCHMSNELFFRKCIEKCMLTFFTK